MGIYQFCAADFGWSIGSMSDDIPVGEVGRNEFNPFLQPLDHTVGHLWQAEFRNLVKRYAFG